jgi:hypothetical protein
MLNDVKKGDMLRARYVTRLKVPCIVVQVSHASPSTVGRCETHEKLVPSEWRASSAAEGLDFEASRHDALRVACNVAPGGRLRVVVYTRGGRHCMKPGRHVDKVLALWQRERHQAFIKEGR